jgi:hypothetical protein
MQFQRKINYVRLARRFSKFNSKRTILNFVKKVWKGQKYIVEKVRYNLQALQERNVHSLLKLPNQ